MSKKCYDYEKCYKKEQCYDNPCCVDVCLDCQKVVTSVYNTCIGSVDNLGKTYFINGVLITYQIIVINTSNCTINDFQIIDNIPNWLNDLNNLCPDARIDSGSLLVQDIPAKVKYTLVCNDIFASGNDICLNPDLGGDAGTIGTTGCPGLLKPDICLNPCDTVNISAELTIPRLVLDDSVTGEEADNAYSQINNSIYNYLQNVVIVTGSVNKTVKDCEEVCVRMKPHIIAGTKLAPPPNPNISYKGKI